MHGFSCRLTEAQLSEIETWPAHVATYPETFGKLLTTHTPEFIGLSHDSGLWLNSSYGEGVIVGVIDTTIWPSSESFHDQGMPAVPEKWKGKCEEADHFKPSYCNRKLIGSRFFLKGTKVGPGSASDKSFSHGTHICSTAAGNFVPGASYSGHAKGTARGVASRAHIAIYAVANSESENPSSVDVLAAFDQAMADGVDVISLSIGVDVPSPYQDAISMPSLTAVDRGIFVAAAAANNPDRWALQNGAPWITTVGAGTVDRSFTAQIVLSNGAMIEGYSFFQLDIFAADVPLYHCQRKLGCGSSSLNRSEVAGKIVLFDDVDPEGMHTAPDLLDSGAFGGLLVTNHPETLFHPDEGYFPMIALSQGSGDTVRNYIACSPGGAKVQSLRFRLTKLGGTPAPKVALYSSRGPDAINPSILKPDLLAPGHQILAAFSRERPYTSLGEYSVVTDYGLMTGTSMAAPHVAGAAALLKSVYPEWTPAAIRSALMTTAYVVDNTGKIFTEQQTDEPMTPTEFGAGHIDLKRAMDPGLVYDLRTQDYVDFLCGQNFTEKQINAILRQRGWHCRAELKVEDLNYPSLTTTTIKVGDKGPGRTVKFRRVLTNVGEGKSVYRATLGKRPADDENQSGAEKAVVSLPQRDQEVLGHFGRRRRFPGKGLLLSAVD
ncbi:unnamed protein product [Linum tenue]|nr:unnamed protein product [Linum tenue]